MINQPDIQASSSSSSSLSSSAATSISSSSSSFVTSAFVEPVNPSNDVIRLRRSVHQRLLQEISAGKTKLRAMDNLQRLFREKVDELERTRARLKNCQRALLRCERRLCDVMARQSMYFRSIESVSNISVINKNSSSNGRQGCAECGGVEGSDTNKAMGSDACKNTETETTSLEKPSLDNNSCLLSLADVSRNELLQLSENGGSGLAVADVDDEVSVQQMKMIKVVNEGSLDSERFCTAPGKSDFREHNFVSLEFPGANQTFQHQSGLCPWHRQPPSANPNLEKSFRSNTANLVPRQPVSSNFSKDLISKLVQQNVRLKMTMKRILGTKGLTITQFLDTQEQQDIIEQLRQEIQRSRIRIQELVKDGDLERKRSRSSADISIADHDQR